VLPVRYEQSLYISEEGILHSHRLANFNSYLISTGRARQQRSNMFSVRYELGFYFPEDGILHIHGRANLKSYRELTVTLFSVPQRKYQMTHDSAVGIATGYALDDRRTGVLVPVVSSSHFSMMTTGLMQPSVLVPGALVPEISRPARQAEHAPPTNAEFIKTRTHISAPPIRFHGVVLS
jgi:hypothetical protein